jgi:hypothetical protein
MRRIAIVLVLGCALGFDVLPVPAHAGGGGEFCEPLTEDEMPPALTVLVRDNCFSPKRLEVVTGQAVTWSLGQIVYGAHTVTAARGAFDSRELTDMFTVRFNKPGTYDFACIYHEGMAGTVMVSGGPLPQATTAATILSEVDPGDDPQAMLANAEHRLARAIAALRQDPPADPQPASIAIPQSAIGLATIIGLFALAITLVRRRAPA